MELYDKVLLKASDRIESSFEEWEDNIMNFTSGFRREEDDD